MPLADAIWGLLVVFVLVCGAAAVAVVALWARGRVRELEGDVRSLHVRLARLEAREPVETAAVRRAAPTTACAPGERDYAAAEAELSAPEARRLEGPRSASVPVPVPVPPAFPAAVPPPLPAARAASAPEPSEAPRAFSLEDFLGGRVLLVAGVVLVLFALAFFLKFAIERDLIDPRARVIVGGLGGIAALVGGERLRRRGFDLFGHGIMGGGLGALYLSLFFAAARYDLLARPLAFGLTALVTAAGVLLALRREAPLLAYLGFLAGYLAPAILGTGEDALGGLTGWLLALHAGLGVTLVRRRWMGLELLAALAGALYFAAWSRHFLAPDRHGAAAGALAALTVGALAVCLLPALLRRQPVRPGALLAGLLAGLFAAGTAIALFVPVHRVAVGGSLAALAAVYGATSAWRARASAMTALDAEVLAGCAVAALAAAVPTVFEGGSVAPAWAVAGVTAILMGARRADPVVALGGLGMVALAQIQLLAECLPMHDGPFTPFVNGPFLSFASPSVALVVAGFVLAWRGPWRRAPAASQLAGVWLYAPVLFFELLLTFTEDRARWPGAAEEYGLAAGVIALALYALAVALAVRQRGPHAIVAPLGVLVPAILVGLVVLLGLDRPGYVPLWSPAFGAGLALVAAAVVATSVSGASLRSGLLFGTVLLGLVVVCAECAAYGENAPAVGVTRADLRRTAQVAMSVCASLYAAAILAAGFLRGRPSLRWCGLGVFALVVAKVFLFDMARLPTIHRVGGFLVLGLLLLGGSFLYHRARRAAAPEGASAPPGQRE